MPTETNQLMENVAAVHSFLEKDYSPLKEEVERLSAQITESVRASKRAALLRQVEPTTQGARVLSGKYRGFDEFDLMLSRAVLRIAESGGVDGASRVDPRMSAEWRNNLEGARADVYESIGRALDSDTAGAGGELTFTGETSEMWRDVHLATSVANLFSLIMMPTTPFQIPYDFGDVSWYRGTPNLAPTSSTPATDRQTLTAARAGQVPGSVPAHRGLERGRQVDSRLPQDSAVAGTCVCAAGAPEAIREGSLLQHPGSHSAAASWG